MSLIAKALLSVTMIMGSGNDRTGSESVTVVKSMEECRNTMRVFQYSKSRIGDIINVRHDQFSMKFTVDPGTWSENTTYKLECTSLEVLQ